MEFNMNELIQENPEYITMAENTQRFSGATWFNEAAKHEILLGGMGGIMSWTALLLARLNPKSITMYDPDVVDATNMAGQLYGMSDVGQHKVDAIADKIAQYACYNKVIAIPRKIEEIATPKPIMISGFDNMEARHEFYKKWVNSLNSTNALTSLYIDARLNAEEFQVIAFTGKEEDYPLRKLYTDKYLFSDSAVDNAVCSYKQTAFCANMIASIITNIYVNFCDNNVNPGYRTIPFFTYYNAEFMTLNME